MTSEKNVHIEFIKQQLHSDDRIEVARENFFDTVVKARAAALKDGIKANSIVINKNMVRVRSFPFGDGFTRGIYFAPDMVCGLNVYLTEDELPEGYSFAVLEGPKDRLAQFESIGMEPEELRKAAEIYRKIKEVEV